MIRASLLHVFEEHRRDIVAFMSARLGCPVTAQDLAQELFLRLFNRENGSEVTNPRAYVFRIAANLVTDHQRRTQRQRALLVEAKSYLTGETDNLSPERHVMAAEEMRALIAIVDRMNPRTRYIFKRNRFDGKPQRAIAEELGISQTAVEKHVRKALKMLAAHRRQP